MTPKTIEKDVGTNKSAVYNIQNSDSDENIDKLIFTWYDKNNNNPQFSGCPSAADKFPQNLATDCGAGVLKIELINRTNQEPEVLARNNFVAFASPSNGSGGSIAYTDAIGDASSFAAQGATKQASCSGGKCSFTISGINKSQLVLRIDLYIKPITLV